MWTMPQTTQIWDAVGCVFELPCSKLLDHAIQQPPPGEHSQGGGIGDHGEKFTKRAFATETGRRQWSDFPNWLCLAGNQPAGSCFSTGHDTKWRFEPQQGFLEVQMSRLGAPMAPSACKCVCVCVCQHGRHVAKGNARTKLYRQHTDNPTKRTRTSFAVCPVLNNCSKLQIDTYILWSKPPNPLISVFRTIGLMASIFHTSNHCGSRRFFHSGANSAVAIENGFAALRSNNTNTQDF